MWTLGTRTCFLEEMTRAFVCTSLSFFFKWRDKFSSVFQGLIVPLSFSLFSPNQWKTRDYYYRYIIITGIYYRYILYTHYNGPQTLKTCLILVAVWRSMPLSHHDRNNSYLPFPPRDTLELNQEYGNNLWMTKSLGGVSHSSKWLNLTTSLPSKLGPFPLRLIYLWNGCGFYTQACLFLNSIFFW